MHLLISLLRTENEENVIMCFKVIQDLHRSFRVPTAAPVVPDSGLPAPAAVPTIGETVPEFLKVIADIFRGTGAVVEETFSVAGTTSETVAASPAGGPMPIEDVSGVPALGGPPTGGTLPLGMKSFKVMQECPTAVVSMFQGYREYVADAIQMFVPLVANVSCCPFPVPPDDD